MEFSAGDRFAQPGNGAQEEFCQIEISRSQKALLTVRSSGISGLDGNDTFTLTTLEGAAQDRRDEVKPGRRGSAPAVPTTEEDRHATT
jgi:hypothetical protein